MYRIAKMSENIKPDLDLPFVQRLLRVAMDAVYHDSILSISGVSSSWPSLNGLREWLNKLLDDVAADMVSGELDPFRSDPVDWLKRKGYRN